jgi:uncharacterized protein YecT (DUF1311 family)
MRLFLGLIFIAAFVSAAPARADECGDAMDQQTMSVCAHRSFEKADAELNAVYKRLQSRKMDNAQAAKLLIAAERAWVAFRDAECEFDAADNIGGSIYPMILSGCLERLTKARIEQLDRYLRCEEGEAACEVPPADK